VGFVYVGPIADSGWTHQHDLGRREMERALGDKVKTSFVENVPEGPDAERVMRQLAQDGHGLIIAASFGYMKPMLKVATDFPATKFIHVSGYEQAPNMALVNARFYEGRYLAGVIAGAMSKTGTAGYVAAFPIPEVLQGINAFTLGMQRSNPAAKLKVLWTNSWFDPGKEREAALALIDQKADVLAYHTGTAAVPLAAQEKGVMTIGYHSDLGKIAPQAQIAAVTHRWGAYYTRAAQAVLAGTWKADRLWGGTREGFVSLTGVAPTVPQATQQMAQQLASDWQRGVGHAFTGPVFAQDGKEMLASGARMTDAQLNAMNYFVRGVESPFPLKP
jgi:simple sugar transport system substrate-binding protein